MVGAAMEQLPSTIPGLFNRMSLVDTWYCALRAAQVVLEVIVTVFPVYEQETDVGGGPVTPKLAVGEGATTSVGTPVTL